MMATLLASEVILNNDKVATGLMRMLTEGNANFAVRTATYNGAYAPRNAGVIWITDSNNQFVKTVKVWANNYRYTLIRWIANSSQNTTGAITGASVNTHRLHEVSWNGKNYQNIDMPDGEYKFNVEFTEHNATAANLGKFTQVSFIKGTQPVTLTIPNETYFRDMSLTWTPVIVNGTISGIVSDEQANPLAGATIEIGALSTTSNSSGFYSIELQPGAYSLSCTAEGYQGINISDITVNAAQTTTVNISMASVSNNDLTDHAPVAVFAPVYPNPAKDYSKLRFYTPAQDAYLVKIYNVKGQLVFSKHGVSSYGWQDVNWNGKDENAKACKSGIYHARLFYKDQILNQRFTLLK